MKKILYASLALVAGLMMASCQQEHIEVVYDPSNVTDQTLQSIQGTELSADGPAVTTTFNPADFKLDVAVLYNLYAASSQDMADKAKMTAAISLNEEGTQGTISMAQKDINSMVYNLGGVADTPFTIYFQLGAAIANDKNAVIASTERFSNVIGATFTPYSTTIKDVDLYEHVWVIGASNLLGAWSHDKVFQFLYDYEKSGNTYTGLIDMGEDHSANQFKLTGAAGWDNSTGNWGVAAGAAEEGDTIQLENGSNDNITQYTAKRFYFFSFNNTSLVLTKSYSFDNVGIVGGFNGWNEKDANLKMNYNPYFHRFWIDYSFAEATELKFTCDDSWDLNWGEDCKPEAGNITVGQGNYRIYLDLNKGEYDFNTSMFGKDEPTGEDNTTPEPAFEGWSVTGAIAAAGINWDGDLDMTQSGDFWVVREVTIAADDQFKFRKAHDWAENIGAAGDVEPFVVEVGTKTVGAAGGKNLTVPAAGVYDLYVNPEELSFYVMTTGDVPAEIATWGVVGTINGWGETADLALAEENGMLVRKGVALTTSDQFKVRFQSAWDANRGAPGTVEPFVMGTDAIQAVQGGKNLSVAADGNYDIWFDELNEVLFVVPAGEALSYWGVVGDITGWGSDRPDYVMYKEGDYFVAKGIDINFDNQFKIRYCSGWDINRGAPGSVEPFKVDANIAVAATQNGKNLGVNEAGKYDIYYKAADEKLFVMAEGTDPATAKDAETPEPGPDEPSDYPANMYMIGEEFGGWSWESDGVVEMFPVIHKPDWGADAEGQFYTVKYFTAGKGFKFNSQRAWGSDFWGLETNDGFTESGGNCTVAADGFYTVHIDLKNKKVHVEPARIYGIGDAFGGWDEEKVAFTADGTTLKATAAADGALRMYAASAIATSPWWTREFNVMDGKIVNRVMDDLAAPSVKAGDVITLDFNALTGSIGGGSSTSGIKTAEELLAYLANPVGDAVIDADIDLSGKEFTPADMSGTLDGGNHTVTYVLTVPDGAEYNGGLFSKVDGTVKNLKVAGSLKTDGTASTGAVPCGGIAGTSAENAVFENCESSVNILQEVYGAKANMLGGIVGNAATGARFTNCVNKGEVRFAMADKAKGRANQLGGIAGQATGSFTMTGCVNEGKILYSANGTARSGGMVGYVNDPVSITFDSCTNKGHILADVANPGSGYEYLGGLTGYVATNGTALADASITFKNCINDGTVEVAGVAGAKGQSRIGGIASYAGCTDAKMKAAAFDNGSQTVNFQGCVNNGKIITDGTVANNVAGGIIGYVENACKALISGCTNNAEVSVAGVGMAGGILGGNGGVPTSLTDVTVTAASKIVAAGSGVAGLLAGKNAAWTSTLSGKVGAAVLSVNEVDTVASADNFTTLLLGAALGEGGSASGVSFGE